MAAKKPSRIDKIPGTNNATETWPIWGEITYGKFHPRKIALNFIDGELLGVDLIQEASQCSDGIQANKDAISFVEKTYGYSSKENGSDVTVDHCLNVAPQNVRWLTESKDYAISLNSFYQEGRYHIDLSYFFDLRFDQRHVSPSQEENEQYEKSRPNL
jgi:hypothetical protein